MNQIYGEVIITPEIAEEYGEKLPEWVRIQAVNDKKYFDFLNTQIDKGEASGLALASEFDDVLLILDDLKARKLANRLNFRFTGTLGVIFKAKQMSLISGIKPLIIKLLSTNFRVADHIVEEILRMSEE
ncbi:MAG TPA: DUF3368 domain-containing protein [Saprospiraceae bacterium]|nr:DUF3368 domain-containing protein [Saprospiraceae bacterium]